MTPESHLLEARAALTKAENDLEAQGKCGFPANDFYIEPGEVVVMAMHYESYLLSITESRGDYLRKVKK